MWAHRSEAEESQPPERASWSNVGRACGACRSRADGRSACSNVTAGVNRRVRQPALHTPHTPTAAAAGATGASPTSSRPPAARPRRTGAPARCAARDARTTAPRRARVVGHRLQQVARFDGHRVVEAGRPAWDARVHDGPYDRALAPERAQAVENGGRAGASERVGRLLVRWRRRRPPARSGAAARWGACRLRAYDPARNGSARAA